MIPVSYYASSDRCSSPHFAHAFARGCGGKVADQRELVPGPVALFGVPALWPVLRAAQAEGREWFYADHGYFERGYFRVARNAYQHDGTTPTSPERYNHFGRPIQPWRKTGSHVLVCPNSAIHFHLHGVDAEAWLDRVTTTLRQHTDREIRVRWKAQKQDRPIKSDLKDAWAVVVFSSAAALDALIMGVPVFTLAPWAASARMGLSDLSQIEQPIYPNGREEFLWSLADHQWSLTELRLGVAWQTLKRERRKVA